MSMNCCAPPSWERITANAETVTAAAGFNRILSLARYNKCMHSLQPFEIISWVSLPAVMFGGFSFLHWLRGRLTSEQETFFRAGHAHAGVLLIMSLVFYVYLGKTELGWTAQYAACGILLTGIGMQSGGFFWHAFLDHNTTRKTGLAITKWGALLLVIAVLLLAYGLIARYKV